MLTRDDIDAMAIATPAVTHTVAANKAQKTGKRVFVEKPMVLSAGGATNFRYVVW